MGLTLAGFFQLYHYALGDSARDAPTLEGFAVIVLTTLPPLFYTLIQLRWLKRRELKSNNPAQI
ncbi:MAG: hypothetical protein AB8C95_11355 [Phycisphaeraceae bacterium]